MSTRALLATWRRTRAASDADALSKTIPTVKVNRQQSADAFHAEWLERAATATADDIGWLVATLAVQLPTLHQSKSSQREPWRRRFLALVPHLPDPRIAETVARETFSRSGRVINWETSIESLPQLETAITADVRQANFIEAWLDKPVAETRGQRAELIEAAPRWIAACRAAGPMDVKVEVEHPLVMPADAGAREVFVDALLEDDSPRGQFIAAQREGTEEGKKRAAKLLRKHRLEWFGPLALVLRNMVFENGLLVGAELNGSHSADAETWRRAAQSSELAAVRSLIRGLAPVAKYAALLAAAPLAIDVDVGAVKIEEVLRGRPLRRIRIMEGSDEGFAERWNRPDHFPSVTALCSQPHLLRHLDTLMRRVRELEVRDALSVSFGRFEVEMLAPYLFHLESLTLRVASGTATLRPQGGEVVIESNAWSPEVVEVAVEIANAAGAKRVTMREDVRPAGKKG